MLTTAVQGWYLEESCDIFFGALYNEEKAFHLVSCNAKMMCFPLSTDPAEGPPPVPKSGHIETLIGPLGRLFVRSPRDIAVVFRQTISSCASCFTLRRRRQKPLTGCSRRLTQKIRVLDGCFTRGISLRCQVGDLSVSGTIYCV